MKYFGNDSPFRSGYLKPHFQKIYNPLRDLMRKYPVRMPKIEDYDKYSGIQRRYPQPQKPFQWHSKYADPGDSYKRNRSDQNNAFRKSGQSASEMLKIDPVSNRFAQKYEPVISDTEKPECDEGEEVRQNKLADVLDISCDTERTQNDAVSQDAQGMYNDLSTEESRQSDKIEIEMSIEDHEIENQGPMNETALEIEKEEVASLETEVQDRVHHLQNLEARVEKNEMNEIMEKDMEKGMGLEDRIEFLENEMKMPGHGGTGPFNTRPGMMPGIE